MNILQYSIGVFPERQGGLVRYSTDLAFTESENNKVFYLYPGRLGYIDKKVRIKEVRVERNLSIFRIDNALPIPLFAGILDTDIYTSQGDFEIYEQFFRENKINIVHIHTLMGLHIEFLQAAKKLQIPVVMTTHDYFGLCPISTLFKCGDICNNVCINESCLGCCQNAHSYFKLAVGQSPIYKVLKTNKIVASLRKKVLLDDVSKKQLKGNYIKKTTDFEKLNCYYRKIFEHVDFFIFNSSQTEKIYRKCLGNVTGKVVYLLHQNICDRRVKRGFMRDSVLRIGYMGECTEFKGYFKLCQAVENLYLKGHNIEIDVFNDYVKQNEYVKRKGRFSAEQLCTAYQSVDLVVIPSQWYETLSFIAVEAISFGTPCMVSNRVGAKDLIRDNMGFMCGIAVEEIEKCLEVIYMNPQLLSQVNSNICNGDLMFDFEQQVQEILNLYLSLSPEEI